MPGNAFPAARQLSDSGTPRRASRDDRPVLPKAPDLRVPRRRRSIGGAFGDLRTSGALSQRSGDLAARILDLTGLLGSAFQPIASERCRRLVARAMADGVYGNRGDR